MFNNKNTSGNNSAQNSESGLNSQGPNVTMHTLEDDLKGRSPVGAILPKNLPPSPILRNDQTKNMPSSSYSSKPAASPGITNTEIPSNNTNQQNYPNPFMDQENPGKVGDSISIKGNGNDGQAYTVPEKPSSSWKKVLIAAVIVLIVLVFGAGGYYFWITRSGNNQAKTITESSPVSQTEQPTKEESLPANKFSLDNPNYLVVDVSSANSQTISQLLKDTEKDVVSENTTVPVEFILRDNDNNPISFSVFATISGITLPTDVIKNVDNNFSLYVYPDESNTRLGIAISVNDTEAVSAAMKKEETKLPSELVPLFLDATVTAKEIKFNNGQYNNFNIRYANLDDDETLSIDYTITNSQLIVGTSKNTERAILDKISK